MKMDLKGRIIIVITVLIVVGALLGSSIYLTNQWDRDVEFESQPQIEFEEATVTKSIPKADSDYYDNNKNGEFDEGIDVPTPDGLSDIEEIYQYGTDVANSDTDGDGMEDGWEAFFSRDPKTNKWIVNPRTGRLAIDPNFRDLNEDPDNDGFDVNGDGRFTRDENLTNLKEYCGGAIFPGHDPFNGENDESDMRYIRSHGGFHLAWSLVKDSPPYPLGGDWDPEYNRGEFSQLYDNQYYNSYNPYKDPLVTTDPTDRDTDNDGMFDGWETYYQNLTTFYHDVFGLSFNQTLDPMDPDDGKGDLDVKKTEDTIRGIEPDEQWEFEPDGLTNIEEFENRTNPILWDTDDDTFYDPGQDTIYAMDDRTELEQLEVSCVSNTDWDRDGEYDKFTNPNDQDTDGDFMSDGFEIFFGLCPLNSSDRFLDLDQDGLLNYLEYRFPETGNQWFRTDPNNPDTDGDDIPDGWEAKNARVITEYWWTVDAAGNEVQIIYEGGRKYSETSDNVFYRRPQNQILDASDGILDRHWYNFTVNPMVSDNASDLDGYWFDDPDIFYDETLGINVEIDGDNDTLPDYHPQADNLTNLLEYNGTDSFPGDYFDGLTDPNDPDTDGDGLIDGEELLKPVRGELISGKWFTTPAAKEFYYTNPNMADSDQDFDAVNLTRSLNDWEEIYGMTRGLGDKIDNDDDGRIDEPDEGLDFGSMYESFQGTNAISPDTDLDGMKDVDEVFGTETGAFDPDDISSGFGNVFTNPGDGDTDSDGAKDMEEITRIKSFHPYITDPNNPDTDNDLLKDGDELKTDYYPYIDFFTWDNYDANDDGDLLDKSLGDFVNTVDRTNPRLFDTDHDGLSDGWEALQGGTTDLLLIGTWVQRHPADPYSEVLRNYLDTNNDGIVGIGDQLPQIRIYLVNPLNPNDKFEDPDDDGLNNWEEYLNNTNPLKWDTDDDSLPDGWEIKYSKKNLDPTRADTDDDDIADDEDNDGNFDVVEEIINGIDDDGDGLIDEEYDMNDGNEDPDHDGMFYYMYVKQPDGSWKYTQFYHPFTSHYEYYWGWSNDNDPFFEITTDPNEADSDGDMLPDGWEIWVSDYPVDQFNKTIYDDDDGLAKGWEDLFNGSLGIFPTDYMPYFLTLDPSSQDDYRGSMHSTKQDTDGNGTGDWADDPDGDNWINLLEYKYHTDPTDSGSNPATANIPIHDTRGAADTETRDDGPIQMNTPAETEINQLDHDTPEDPAIAPEMISADSQAVNIQINRKFATKID